MASATLGVRFNAGFITGTSAVCLVIASSMATAAQDRPARPAVAASVKPPKLTLKAENVGESASRIRFTAHLAGGTDDDQDLYCPQVVWEWSDGTKSESAHDCRPYERGQTEITRYFTLVRMFVAGDYRVKVRLLTQRGKEVGSAGTNFIVR
jgi:hypothetical protein